MPEEARKEAAVGLDDREPPRAFDILGYLLQRLDSMEGKLREEIRQGDTALREEIRQGDAALRVEIQHGDAMLRQEIGNLRLWIIGLLVTILVGFSGVIITFLR